MTVLLSLLSAIGAGTSDFLGGLASRSTRALLVTMFSHLGGVVVALVLTQFVAADPVTADFIWGAVAGVAGAAGLMSIYAGYARARVAIAAPLAGVGAASLPVVFSSVFGDDSLSTLAVAGIVLGLVAIALTSMSQSPGQGTVAESLMFGIGGAIGLGMLLLGLSQAGENSGMWPLVAARAAGFVALALVVVATRHRVTINRSSVAPILGIAVLGTLANMLFIFATRQGSTSVAAVVTSLFPAVTVGWAFIVLRERLGRVQLVGVALAVVAVGFIVAG